ncbi:hypothetical protein LTR84_005466 [Exophiala bonariae]|uniref:Uncharacterized protein n=1 Tax=Exophiala bonariae TaxID=1690606 RepID=A0AAV9N803_9EURO|nr:hypothetical protein LTR84_005466 [Exophiala bonariae]
MDSCQLFEAWRRSLGIMVNTWKFKDSAFVGIIRMETPVLNAFDYMLESPLVTDQERIALSKLRELLYIAAANPRIIPSPDYLDELTTATEGVNFVFNEDRKRQGQYLPPPIMVQPVIGPNGQPIPKSFELDGFGLVKMNRDAMNLHYVPGPDGGPGTYVKFDPVKIFAKKPEINNDDKKTVLGEGLSNVNVGTKPTNDKGTTAGNTTEQVGYFDRFKQSIRRGFN